MKFILMIIKEIIGNTFFHDSKLPKDIKMYQLQCLSCCWWDCIELETRMNSLLMLLTKNFSFSKLIENGNKLYPMHYVSLSWPEGFESFCVRFAITMMMMQFILWKYHLSHCVVSMIYHLLSKWCYIQSNQQYFAQGSWYKSNHK